MIKLKALLTSLSVHLLVFLGLIILLRLNAESSAKYIEIDLSLIDLNNYSQKSSEENKNFRPKNIEKIAKSISCLKESVINEDQTKKYFVEEKEAKDVKNEKFYTEKDYGERETKNVAMIKDGFSGVGSSNFSEKIEAKPEKGEGSGIESKGKGSGVDSESLKEKFLIEKLFIISKIVQNNINYPYIARKMGWEGKVVISFVLTKEGKINLLTVEKSSGYEVLDENAIKTVKEVSKYFPLPPIDVKIKLPISYKLN